MLKKTLFIYFVFFSLCLLQGEESIEQTTDGWENIDGKEIVLFVNSNNKSKKRANGTKKAPFKRIEDAFTHLNGLKKKDIKATIHITGSFASKNVYVVTIPTRIVGLDDYKLEAESKTYSHISFEKNAGFVVTSSKLFIEKCSISRREFVGEPRSVPILYSSNSFISMKNVSITAKEGGSLFRFIESSVSIDASIVNSNQNGFCNIIETIKSKLKINDVHFNCNGRFVVTIDSVYSSINMQNVHCNILTHLSAIALNANGGEINVENSIFNVAGKYAQKDEAISYNSETKLDIKNLELAGFNSEAKLRKN